MRWRSFDFWAAKATLAAEMDGTRAETTTRSDVVLLSARHPGLTGRVVPIDIRLGDGYSALVVTGPNTGGKTVTLRTLGLLSAMHQAGLHVPAEDGSRLPVFRDIFADIGDEQSIAQSLSTFSGHLRAIIRIITEAGPRTLVLLDELGAGTDPTEGSALAQALLDHFIRAGALVAASHPLRGAEGVRPDHARRPERLRRVRPGDALTDLPADHRPAGRLPGVRHRRAAGPAARDRRRRALPPVRRRAGVRGDPGRHPDARRTRPARRSSGHGSRRRARPSPGRQPTRSGAARAGSARRSYVPRGRRRRRWSRRCGTRSGRRAGGLRARR